MPNSARYTIRLPVPEIRSLSLGGGGARGCVYGDVLNELDHMGVLDQLEDVLGVSAGSITGSLLAIGASPQEITNLSQQTNFKELLGSFSLFNGGGLGLFTTRKLEQMVKNNLQAQFTMRIEELKSYLSPEDPAQEEVNWLGNQPLTFETLAKLQQFYIKIGQKDKIKTLSILAVDKHHAKPCLFSHLSNSNILIADAVVASCAIPPVFKPHTIEIDGQKKQFMDGGMHRSLLTPEYQIPKFVTNKERRLDSVLLWLEPEEEANQKIYGASTSLNVAMIFIGWLIEMVFGANGVQAKFGMEQGAKNYGQNVIPMDTNISPNDFGISVESKQILSEQSVRSVKNYFQNFREGASYIIDGGSLEECLYELPYLKLDEAIDSINEHPLDKSITDEVKAHRALQESEYSKIILHQLEQLIVDLQILENAIAAYCTPLSMTIDSIQSQRIYNINMERVFNGCAHQLGTFFSQNEVNEANYPHIYKLKERYLPVCDIFQGQPHP